VQSRAVLNSELSIDGPAHSPLHHRATNRYTIAVRI